MELFTKEFIMGYFSRNKKYLLISLAIFLVAFVLGAIIAYINIGDKYGLITATILQSHVSPITGFDMGAWDLFSHNFVVDIGVVLFGFLFSIVSVLLVIFNAFSIGAPFGTDFIFASLTIVPHSIIEYSASVIALVGAFLITRIEIDIIKSFSHRDISVGDVINDSNTKIKDIVLSFIFMTVILIIAAFIEAYITPMIFNLYFGF